jgi:hypothetical protein
MRFKSGSRFTTICPISIPTLHNALQDLDLTYKVLKRTAAPWNERDQADWRHMVASHLTPEQCVFTDKSCKNGRSLCHCCRCDKWFLFLVFTPPSLAPYELRLLLDLNIDSNGCHFRFNGLPRSATSFGRVDRLIIGGGLILKSQISSGAMVDNSKSSPLESEMKNVFSCAYASSAMKIVQES